MLRLLFTVVHRVLRVLEDLRRRDHLGRRCGEDLSLIGRHGNAA